MEGKPVVSIIMPLFNKRPYVKRAIESIQQQTYQDWELIIVDDGSTDGSVDEIPQGEKRIRFVAQENSGPSAARNHGIRMAEGDFVTFIDADNFFYPEKLEKELAILSAKNRTEWMISPFDYKINDHIEFRGIRNSNDEELRSKPVKLDDVLNQVKISDWHIEGLFIRRDLLQRLEGFREDMRCYEITDFFIRCALMQPKAVVNSEPLYCVIDVPESAFKVSAHRVLGLRQLGESCYKLAKDYPDYSNQLEVESNNLLLQYSARLILNGRKREAREFLLNKFPFSRNRKWWKIWAGSWLPNPLLMQIFPSG